MDIRQNSAADLEGYTLVRQAIEEGDADAWAAIADRYRRQIVAWANHCCARLPIHEPPTEIAEQALARAWAARSAAQFESLPDLAAFLDYLRTCVIVTTLDHAREQSSRPHHEHVAHSRAAGTPLEQAALEQLQPAELWRLIVSAAENEQEQLLVREGLLYALAPRAICALHPDQFTSVAAVYRLKHNLFKRLQHSQAIERLFYADTLTQSPLS